MPEMQKLPLWAQKTQGLQFFSTVRGMKASMDAWVPSGSYLAFLDYCEEFGLSCIPDVKFVKADDYAAYSRSVGGEHLTTTKTLAFPVETDHAGEIHCFLSANPENAEESFRYGWYPIVSGDRVVYKSYHDTIEFGRRLGYPDCCVDFFFEKNDWNSYNFPAEIFRRSRSFDFRCNPFWKDFGGSYVYHMPCRFDCPKTVEWVESVRAELLSGDADFVRETDRRLRLPVLSIREQKTYAFEGRRESDGSVSYEAFYRLGKPEEGDISDLLSSGDRVAVCESGTVRVYAKGAPVGEYVPLRTSGAIEEPFLAFFE